MLLNEISKQLIHSGYRKSTENEAGIWVFIKAVNGIYYSVFVVNDCGQKMENPYFLEQLMQESCRAFRRRQKETKVLGVIVTDDVEASKRLMEGWNGKWLFDVNARRLIIFENQPDEFLDVRPILEDICSGQGTDRKGRMKSALTGLQNFTTPVNGVIILLNVLVFLILELIGNTSDPEFMYEHGAMQVQQFWQNREYWRALTSAFLHFGIEHLFGNMLVLWYLGMVLERIVGSVKYVIIYLISAVGANLIAVGWYTYAGQMYVVSAGASGAIFGVIGVLLWIIVREKGKVEGLTGYWLFWMCAYTLYQGFYTPGVGNSAHVGGLIVGILCGILFYRRRKRNTEL